MARLLRERRNAANGFIERFHSAAYLEKDCAAPIHRMIIGSDFLTVLQPMMDVTWRYRANQLTNYCDTVGDVP